MKLLVTGGAGFIGNNFIRYWLDKHKKDYIVNFDKLTYAGHLSSTKDFKDNPRYTFVKGDITNPKSVENVMKGIDFVVNFAAESHVDRSISDPFVFVKTNVLGTSVLLDSALKNEIKRFHHVSTDEVFGALDLESKKKFSEDTPYDPNSPYSASKAASDHLVRAYHETYGLDVTISNCANNYGPFHDPEKLFPRFITNLIDGKKVPIYGDGKYVRDWLYVGDHCRAIDLIIKKAKAGSTYVVGGLTKDINNLEVTKKMLKIFGYDDSMIKFIRDREGHDRRYSVNWKKIHVDLGWKPEFTFDEYLEKTIQWYKENEWWWRPIKTKTEKYYKSVKRS